MSLYPSISIFESFIKFHEIWYKGCLLGRHLEVACPNFLDFIVEL